MVRIKTILKVIYGEFSRRFSIYNNWLLGKRYNVSFLELNKVFFGAPLLFKALKKVRITKEKYENLIIHFKNIRDPLYFPREMKRQSLYQVITESFYPDNWHYYNKEGTTVGKDDTVIDCGAAEGLFSLLIAKNCKKVYVIEPLPRFIEVLKLTFKGFYNVEIIPFALSDKVGKTHIISNNISSSLTRLGRGKAITVTTIDKLFYEKKIPISYIKVDIEGYEIKMLKGAYKTIKKNNPKIAITTYHNKSHALWISRYLKKINPQYFIKLKGIDHKYGTSIMLHAWVE